MSGRSDLEIYRPIVEDWEDFEAALSSPAPTYLRVNRFKTDLRRADQLFKEHNLPLEKNPYFDNLYHWRSETNEASRTFLHWAGYYYIKDISSLLPVEALAPPVGATVLDLCAAPGGKTLHLAELVAPDGIVIANDPLGDRRIALQANVQRFNTYNVYLTAYRGQSIPKHRQFDYILVDAPCSGEGANRYLRKDFQREAKEKQKELVERQYRILRAAFRVLSPGGRLVYSTCTFAPEENEAVINRLLKATKARLKPIKVEPELTDGVIAWRGQDFNRSLQLMKRCYPHHLNGCGMVFGLLTKPA